MSAGLPPRRDEAVSWAALAALAAFSLWAGLQLAHPLFDHDAWFHLKSGQLLWRLKRFPPQSLFSYVPGGDQWLKASWLYDLLAWGLYRSLGLPDLILARVLLGLASLALVLDLALRRGAGLAQALACCSAALLATRFFWTERPQVFAFFFFAWLLWFLGRPAGRARLAGIFLASALWSNFHGSAVLAPALVALFEAGAWLEDPGPGSRRPALAALGAAFLGSLCNPQLGGQYAALARLSSVQAAVIARVNEWRAPAWGTDPWFFAMVLALALGLFPAWRGRRRAALPLLLALAGLGLYTRRLIPFFCLAGAAYLPAWFSPPRWRAGRWLVAGLALAWLAQSVLLFRGPLAPFLGADLSDCPVGAADFLAAHPPQGRLGNLYDDGAYLIWRLCPRTRVFVDSRMNFPDSVFQDCRILSDGDPGWREVPAKYGMSCLLVRCFKNPPYTWDSLGLALALLKDPSWRLAYFDDRYLLFARPGELAAQKGAWPWYRGVDPIQARITRVYPDTLRLLKARLASQGQDGLGLYLLGLAYLKSGRPGPAGRSFRRCLGVDPGFLAAGIRLRDLEKAPELERAQKTRP